MGALHMLGLVVFLTSSGQNCDGNILQIYDSSEEKYFLSAILHFPLKLCGFSDLSSGSLLHAIPALE